MLVQAMYIYFAIPVLFKLFEMCIRDSADTDPYTGERVLHGRIVGKILKNSSDDCDDDERGCREAHSGNDAACDASALFPDKRRCIDGDQPRCALSDRIVVHQLIHSPVSYTHLDVYKRQENIHEDRARIYRKPLIHADLSNSLLK